MSASKQLVEKKTWLETKVTNYLQNNQSTQIDQIAIFWDGKILEMLKVQ